jgi:ABC-2 type transport system ATP-binding protein
LLLDEPTAGLDPEARATFSALIRSLQKQGMTFIISSHILAELEDYCTSMLVLRDGQVINHRNNAQTQNAPILRIVFAHDAETFLPAIKENPSVIDPILKGQEVRFAFKGDAAEQNALLMQMLARGALITAFESGYESFQDAYISLAKSRG